MNFVVIVLMLSAKEQEQKSQIITQRIGHYESLYSKILNEERTLLVHLPDDYKTSLKKYPVLYILDAEDTHRFKQAIAALTYYSGARRLPKMIVVGIYNTNRTRDLTPYKIMQRESSGGGDVFLNFIDSELNPYIENKYRTAQNRILFGGSSAGMFTLYVLFNRPELFNVYIASRPALNSTDDYTWDSDVFIRKARELFAARSSLNKSLYIDYGAHEDALHDPNPIYRLSQVLEYESPKDFQWNLRETGESGYRSAESLKDGLLSVFDTWYYPADSIYIKGLAGIKNHSERMSLQFGYNVSVADLIVEKDLIMFGYRFLEHDMLDNAISFFRYCAETYSESWNAYDSLGEAYLENGQKNLAIENYKKSLELNPDNTNAVQILQKLKSR